MPPLAEVLHAENLSLKGRVGELEGEVTLLRRQIEKLQRQVFGPGKSEKLDRAQLLFQLKELEALVEKAAWPAQAVVVIEPEEVKAEP